MTTPIHADLFPETLVVELVNGQPMTSSLKIAEHFDKRHDDVLKSIRKLVKRTKNPERLGNFAESFTTFTSANGAKRKRPIFLLTRDGFDFTVMGFTGEKADDWKWKFIDAFNFMQALIHTQRDREAQAFHATHPKARTVVDGTTQGLPRAAICQQAGWRSPSTVTRHRQRLRELGLLQAE